MNKCSSSSSSSLSELSSLATAIGLGESDLPLLPNLPDDLALQCIARVPRFYHGNLSLVSKSWLSMLRSPLFFSTRNRLNCTKHILYLLVDIYYSSDWFALGANSKKPRSLSPVPPIPSDAIHSAFVALGPRIYAVGGSVRNSPSSDVWIYDSQFNRWEIGRKMSVEREFPVAGVLNGKIYVMGGCVVDSQTMNWAEVFDPALGSWATVPSPVEVMKVWGIGCESAVVENKFYVVYNREGFVFDPYDLSWRDASVTGLDFDFGLTRGACVIDGIWYRCSSRGISGFDLKEGKWKELKGVKKDFSLFLYDDDGSRMVNVGGRMYLLTLLSDDNNDGGDKQQRIYCAEVEIRKDSNGGLWGSVIWLQTIHEVPMLPVYFDCFSVEF